MVNIVIYLKMGVNAKELAELLLKEKLIASASIDIDNVCLKIEDGEIIQEYYNVITAQSKALLFNSIVEFVEHKLGEEIAINSIPIVGSSKLFNQIVKSKTNPI